MRIRRRRAGSVDDTTDGLRAVACILGAKGRKDRVVRLPEAVIPEIERQMAHARTIWERDQRERVPVELPHQLARKYPEYQFAWQWAWLFPMHKP